MKNNVIRCLYIIIALFCVVGCVQNADKIDSKPETVVSEPQVTDNEKVNEPNETVTEQNDTNTEVTEPVSEPVQNENTTTTPNASNNNTNNTKQTTQPKQTAQPTQTTQPTQQQQTPVWDGNIDHTDYSWVCPNPSAHGWTASEAQYNCYNSKVHERYLIEAQKEQEHLNNYYTQGAAKWGMSVEEFKVWMKTHCDKCGRPFGDGHNGTCHVYFEDSTQRWTCHNYD